MKTFNQFKTDLVESRDKSLDPPAVLIMRRKWIRQYPNQQRVAIYLVDKINKYITVPYTEYQWSSSGVPVEEETEIKD
jgi:hypothetical protein